MLFQDIPRKENHPMKDFTYSYPTHVYFGKGLWQTP